MATSLASPAPTTAQPTTPPAIKNCPTCYGGGVIYVRACEQHNFPHPTCETCKGKGWVEAKS